MNRKLIVLLLVVAGSALFALRTWMRVPERAAVARPETRTSTPVAATAAEPVREPVTAAAPSSVPQPSSEPAPVPATEWNSESEVPWTELQPWLEDGVIAGVVWRSTAAVAGARVRLWGDPIGLPGGEFGSEPNARETRSDERGEFRFEGLPPGKHYSLRADEGDDHVTRHVITLGERKLRGIVLPLGTGEIVGVVRDELGQLRIGAVVRVAGIGPQPSRGATTRTDGNGAFRIGGLLGGRYHVIARLSPDWGGELQRLVSIEEGGRADVRFGHAGRLARVRLTLVDVGDTERDELALFLVHRERRDEVRVFPNADLLCEVELPPGNWDVHLVAGLFQGPLIGSLEVDTRDIEQELSLP